ncbi:MAG TPA: M56 family metallopeptidase, partial [bacterium]|nr:M56 family metallopeptidase [bacterium]
MIPPEPLQELSQWWLRFMERQAVESVWVFLLVGCIWYLWRRRISVQLSYFLFLLVLINLIFPDYVSLYGLLDRGLAGLGAPLAMSEAGWGSWLPSLAAPRPGEEAGTAMDSATPSASLFPPATVLMMIWSLIVLMLFLRFLRYQWIIRKILKHIEYFDPATAPLDLALLQKQAGIKRLVRWAFYAEAASPFVWGIVHPVVIIPPRFFENQFSAAQAQWILLHELAHIRRWDNLVHYFQGVMQILYFFNPTVWITNFLMDQFREWSCDDIALKGSAISRKECGEGLLRVILQNCQNNQAIPESLFLLNNQSFIRRRLARIMDEKRKFYGYLTLGELT